MNQKKQNQRWSWIGWIWKNDELMLWHEAYFRWNLRQQCNKASKEIDLYYDGVIEKLPQYKEQVKEQVHYTASHEEKVITRHLQQVIYRHTGKI